MNDSAQDNTEKLETLNRLLEDEYVLVHLNPRHAGVSIPELLAGRPTISLKLSRFFRGVMAIDADGVVAELLFKGSYFSCTLPFDSIWGMTSLQGKNIVWPRSAPPEVLKSLLDGVSQAQLAKTEKNLAALDSNSAEPSGVSPQPTSPQSTGDPAAKERSTTSEPLQGSSAHPERASGRRAGTLILAISNKKRSTADAIPTGDHSASNSSDRDSARASDSSLSSASKSPSGEAPPPEGAPSSNKGGSKKSDRASSKERGDKAPHPRPQLKRVK